jgi:hypothetical protein
MSFINLYHENKDGTISKDLYKLNTPQEKVNDTPHDLFCQLRRFCYKHSWLLLVYSIIVTITLVIATIENALLFELIAEQQIQIDSYERLDNMQRGGQ